MLSHNAQRFLQVVARLGDLQEGKINPRKFREELLDAGLIERVPRGRMRFNVRLTDAGRAFLAPNCSAQERDGGNDG